MQLISPPPEECLRSPPTTGRKRPLASPGKPQPTKYHRESSTNYDPPNDVFTPPREVFVSPITATIRVSKSSRRKTSTKKFRRALTPLVVKLEMPDVDLNAPMPPPSPGDDPLLLSSSVEPPSSPTPRHNSPAWHDKRTGSPPPMPFQKLRFDCDFPSSSLPPEEQPSLIQDDDLDITPPDLPFFELADNPNDDSCSDSEHDLLLGGSPTKEGEGEFTGRFLEVLVRTKADAPKNKGHDPFVLSLERHPELPSMRMKEANPFDFTGIGEEEANGAFASMGNDLAEQDNDLVEEQDSLPPFPSSDEEQDILPLEPSSTNVLPTPAASFTTTQQDVPDTTTLLDAEHHHTQDPDSQQEIPQDTSTSPPPHTSPDAEFDFTDTAEHDSSSSSRETSPDPDIIKITSTDPRAAARAAAILKQHNYDCFTKRELKKKRRHSDGVYQRAGGSGVLSGGIEKKRRKSLGVVRGENVYFPPNTAPSPVVTLGDLLKEAEEEVSVSMSGGGGGGVYPFLTNNSQDGLVYETPAPSRIFSSPFLPGASSALSTLANRMNTSMVLLTPKVPMTPGETCYDPLTGERMWTKEEWKRLDACFTDERLEIASRRTSQLCTVDVDMDMAGVDEVVIDDVVERFVEWMGGWKQVNEFGPEWSRESLQSRTRALRSKQRKGMAAPPTSIPPSFLSPAVLQQSSSRRNTVFSPFEFGSTSGMMDVPDFTPIRPVVRERSTVLQKRQWPPLPPGPEAETVRVPVETSTPASLLAPRYSHLLEEAKQVSKEVVPRVEVEPEESSVRQESDTALEEEMESEDSPTTLVEEEQDEQVSEPALEENEPQSEREQEQEQETIGKRVKGILFSYLPTLRRTPGKPTTNKRTQQSRPGLPIPPQDVLSKPRGPVVTPAREPLPKPVHPKDLVHLQQAPPVLPPASKIPRVVHPKQLVELNHVTPPNQERQQKTRQRKRSSGASSVKDLIKGFEAMEEESSRSMVVESEGGRGEVRKMRSVGEWRKDVPSRGALAGGGVTFLGRSSGEGARPTWKP